MLKYDKNNFISICKDSRSMQEAATCLGMHFNTFKRIALKLNCYFPNQAGKGINKKPSKSYSTEEILNGKYPSYQTYKLKKRLIKEGIKTNICEECGVSSWNNKQLECELDHIDGNSKNHSLENLKMLCPNCHSQTPTFRAKNFKNKITIIDEV